MALHGRWYMDLRSGETKTVDLAPGQRAWVTHAELVDPTSAAAGQSVDVALRAKNGDDLIRIVLSAERPVAPVRSIVMLEEAFQLEREDDETADSVVRFVGGWANLPATPEAEAVEDGEYQEEAVLEEEEDEDREAVDSEDDEDEEMVEGTVYDMIVREDSDDDGGYSDYDVEEDEEEESDGEFEVGGFMRVVDADTENQEGGGGDRQILVPYRYTHFSAAWSDGSVEARGSTKEHQLRFIAAAGHGARSLAWAGALLAPLIYPEGCSEKLRELWTALASQVSLPPGAARVKVFVDVAIVRQADSTPERKGNILTALTSMMTQPWPTRFTGMMLNLPEPVGCGHDEDKAAHDHSTDGVQRLNEV